ncbi:FCS-Like Zinc finger 5-like [Primulina tabacum]|uniref:FCS-Like Zinc finger 5-like n=1 Tax=Primulina tabacum TaxID=48773 RepID=UPI003F5A1A93
MLGKRARRPPIKRTTSMTEFHLDRTSPTNIQPHNGGSVSSTPRQHRRNSADFVETSHFLRVCFLCQRRLVHGHDIYMYRFVIFIYSHEFIYFYSFKLICMCVCILCTQFNFYVSVMVYRSGIHECLHLLYIYNLVDILTKTLDSVQEYFGSSCFGRGDSAFCSLECRQQQMVQDERIDKCSMASKKDAGTAASASGVAQAPTKSERVAAV